jgi:hypothetical protein
VAMLQLHLSKKVNILSWLLRGHRGFRSWNPVHALFRVLPLPSTVQMKLILVHVTLQGGSHQVTQHPNVCPSQVYIFQVTAPTVHQAHARPIGSELLISHNSQSTCQISWALSAAGLGWCTKLGVATGAATVVQPDGLGFHNPSRSPEMGSQFSFPARTWHGSPRCSSRPGTSTWVAHLIMGVAE